jgi:hypothetical protein
MIFPRTAQIPVRPPLHFRNLYCYGPVVIVFARAAGIESRASIWFQGGDGATEIRRNYILRTGLGFRDTGKGAVGSTR